MPQSPERRSEFTEEKQWDFETLKYYLLQTSINKDFYLPRDENPQFITLSNSWYNVLDELSAMSGAQEDEGYAVIGGALDIGKIVIQIAPKPGDGKTVPHEVILAERKRILKNTPADVILGDNHSHPRMITWNYGKISGVSRPSDLSIPHFSTADLFWMVGKKNDVVGGLADGFHNLLVLRTKESEQTDRLQYLKPWKRDTDHFSRYWYEQSGCKDRPSTEQERIRIQNAIAEHHSLVIYKGFSRQPLKRII